METMIICYSYHHGNTKKIADVMAEALNAEVVDPHDVNAEMIDTFDLIGFGSGIAFGKHYKQIREVVDALPVCHKNAFIFSTRGGPRLGRYHDTLRAQLAKKGWKIIGEFSCRGFDTYGITKLWGGVAKGRPNERDLRDAEEFARSLAISLA